ncbi:hypothetical protein NBRGN_075_00390 [Nocardia brasiliensis NBRC 14402]|nr:hypothetical protein NBRGN_075_00390 [Nocardia brasiliensis NBRC 14402]
MTIKSGHEIRIKMASGKEVSVPVDDICGKQLSRGALVRREKDMWITTDAAKNWLDTGRNSDLADHLHANVKFFGELLRRSKASIASEIFSGLPKIMV